MKGFVLQQYSVEVYGLFVYDSMIHIYIIIYNMIYNYSIQL